ncbi:MAG TPA: DUF5666 domain-containing protein [Nitrospiria bacterium]|jgi:hypothetical protein
MKPGLNKILMVGIFSLSLLSCGGETSGLGGGGSTPSGSGGGGIIGTGKTIVGKINALDGPRVNGLKLNTVEAVVTLNGKLGTMKDLEVGMIVSIQGKEHEEGILSVTRIIFENEMEGPIDSIDLVQKTLFVQGQTVFINDATVFSKTTGLDTLKQNNMIEISGYLTFKGIQATWIRLKPISFIPGITIVNLKGTVSSLNPTGKTFFIQDQRIDFSNSSVFPENFPPEGLANGLWVDVEGTRDNPGILHATRIQKKEPTFGGQPGDNFDIEGFVTKISSLNQFYIGNIIVNLKGETDYKGGRSSDIGLNVFLEVEGILNENMALIAEKISFRTGNDIWIEAQADFIDPVNQSINVFGHVLVMINLHTPIRDKRDHLNPFGLDDIVSGERIRITGFQKGSFVVANLLEREDQNPTVILQGKVQTGSINQPEFSILGVLVKTTSQTEFKNIQNKTLLMNKFFMEMTSESLVRVEGSSDGGTILANKVKIEN